jgi:hypothetical protein
LAFGLVSQTAPAAAQPVAPGSQATGWARWFRLCACNPTVGNQVCGDPGFSSASERATFLWKDCDGSDAWHLRVTGGGTPSGIDYTGLLETDSGSSTLDPFSIEATDVLDTSDPNTLDYLMKIYNNGVDGIDFTLVGGACFTPTGLAGLPVLLGSGRTLLETPDLDLVTLTVCATEPDADGDGLSDAEEAALGTDPANPDTDGGGVNDGTEVANGTDPFNPAYD